VGCKGGRGVGVREWVGGGVSVCWVEVSCPFWGRHGVPAISHH
jgi:hypothetical protein